MYKKKEKHQVNFMDKVPVRNYKEFKEIEGKITVLIPKFKNQFASKLLIPKNKSAYMKFHLDETGSAVWKLIDDSETVEGICKKLRYIIGSHESKNDELEEKLVLFLSNLCKTNIIKFT